MEWVVTILTGFAFLLLVAPAAMLLLTVFVLVPLAHLVPQPPMLARATFECPFSRRTVNAAFEVSPGAGRPTDVHACSVFGAGPVRCRKGCLATATSGWAPSPMLPRFALTADGPAFR